MTKTVVRDDFGIRLSDDNPKVNVKLIQVYRETSMVNIVLHIGESKYFVYLDCMEAMSFSKAFEQMAIDALKASV